VTSSAIHDGPATVTATFVFTDIEGSSRQWDLEPDAMAEALRLHDDLLTEVIARHGGTVFKHTGDGVGAVFAEPADALAAAADAQAELQRTGWPTSTPLRVRMGIHTGEAEPRRGDYFGHAVNRVARLCELGDGGHVLVSAITHHLVRDAQPPGCELRYVADVHLRGMSEAEGVFQLFHPSLTTPAIVLERSDARRSIGPDRGPLVGRLVDLDTIETSLRQARLVTLTGLGGVGKTSLAATTGRRTELVPRDRVWWVDLVAIDGPGVTHAIAASLGVGTPGRPPIEAAADELGRGPALIVLDNCEHIIEPVAEIVITLLAACPDLRILSTSRIPLDVEEERVVGVSPLTPPSGARSPDGMSNPAVELFVRRAREATPAFRVDIDDVMVIEEICRRLDGFPLALELAAARVRSLAPAQILDHLGERFRLLRTAQPSSAHRHRSLEAVVAWSYDSLGDRERTVLDRLSVFAAPFSLDAATSVAGIDHFEVVDALDILVTRAMVEVVEDADQNCYRLLESIREFASIQLEADRALRAETLLRHRRHQLALVEATAATLHGPDEAVAVRSVHRALPDVGNAFTRACSEGDVDTCLRLTVGLYEYAFWRMRGEVANWALQAVSMDGAGDHALFSAAAGAAGFLAWQRGDLDEARRWTELGVTAGDSWLAAAASAVLAQFEGDLDRHDRFSEEALAAARRDGNRTAEATTLGRMAFNLLLREEPRQAIELARTSMELAVATGNPSAISHAHWAVGVAHYGADATFALDQLERSMALAESVDNRLAINSSESLAEELRGSRAPTVANLRAALDRLEQAEARGLSPAAWYDVRNLGRLLADVGQLEAAALALEAEAAAPLTVPLRSRERAIHDAAMGRVRDGLGEHRVAAIAQRAATLRFSDLLAELRRALAGLPDA
jgi:predicted ATPase/class 3 adenylate cyclase